MIFYPILLDDMPTTWPLSEPRTMVCETPYATILREIAARSMIVFCRSGSLVLMAGGDLRQFVCGTEKDYLYIPKGVSFTLYNQQERSMLSIYTIMIGEK